MKLALIERLLVANPVRALVQRHYEAPLLVRMGGRLAGARVLEIGCGTGRGLGVIHSSFGAAHVYGMDLDLRMARVARTRAGRLPEGSATVSLADAAALPLGDRAVDAVFSFGALHHVPDWQAAVAEVGRVLRPGGLFFFEEVTRAALERWHYKLLFVHPTLNRFSEEEFLQELSARALVPCAPISRVLWGDIFIGVARRTPFANAMKPAFETERRD